MITVYTSTSCIQCTMTKRALDRAGIAYVEVDVHADPAAADELRAAGHQAALPVVEAGIAGTWTGFQPDKIQQLAG